MFVNFTKIVLAFIQACLRVRENFSGKNVLIIILSVIFGMEYSAKCKKFAKFNHTLKNVEASFMNYLFICLLEDQLNTKIIVVHS